MEIYDIRIEPNQTREINVTGSYVYFYNGSAGGADTTITLRQDSRGERVLLQPGQAYRMKSGETGSRWLIGNLRGAGTIVGQLVIGSGELTDNRISGSVEVIDGGKNRTRANAAYTSVASVGSLAGQFPFVALFNPAASNRAVVINAFTLSTNVDQTIYMGWRTGDPGGAVGVLRNKNLGVANTASSSGRSGALVTIDHASVLYAFNVKAGTTEREVVTEPIVIGPGFCAIATGLAEASQLSCTFQFYEESL